MLDVCDENAKATLIVVIPPVIVAKQNQTVLVGKNVTIECIIENVGIPPFVVYRWKKFKQRLMTDRKKYISQLIENRMFLTIVNSTIDDESYYQCILETPVFQRRKAFIYLSVNDTRITHAGSINGVYYIIINYTSI